MELGYADAGRWLEPERRAQAQTIVSRAGEPGRPDGVLHSKDCDSGRVRRDVARWYLADEALE